MLYYIRTTRETQEFIEKYLDERGYPSKNPTHIQKMWEEINADFKRPGVMPEDVARYIINNMSFENYSPIFTPTLYWTIIADWVKLLAGYTCILFTSHNIRKHPNMEFTAHHPNYKIHGYELQNIHVLVCLCNPCHSKFHDKPIRELYEIESEIPVVINDEDIFNSPVIAKKYISYKIAVIHYLVKTRKFQIKV